MEEIFRFLMLRPPEPGTALDVEPSPDFAARIEHARHQPNPREELKRVAAAVLAHRGVHKPADLHLGVRLDALGRRLSGLLEHDPARLGTLAGIDRVVYEVCDLSAERFMALDQFKGDRERLSDNLVAAKLLSRDNAFPAVRMEALLRVMALLIRVAEGDESAAGERGVREALLIPTAIALPDALPEPDGGGNSEVGRRHAREPGDGPGRTAALTGRITALEALATALLRARPADLALPPAGKDLPGVPPGTPLETLRGQLVREIERGSLNDIKTGRVQTVVGELAAVTTTGDAHAADRESASRLTLREPAVDALPAGQRELLADLGLDLTVTPLPDAVAVLTEHAARAYTELGAQEEPAATVGVFGSVLQAAPVPEAGAAAAAATGPGPIPTTRGTIKPVGVGDLLVVRQQLKKYEAGEVAHIENVLEGESKKRVHRRARTTEQTTTEEVETVRDEERDVQTTERFELQRETQRQQEEYLSVKAGLSVSGKYGPTVEFKAATDFTYEQSKQESAKTASKYSKEMTDRASTKVSERRREQTIRRTLEVFEESNEHGIDNSGPQDDDHVIGVYQWVDKVYEAQVFNHGARMMFDFMVPEPGAFWLHATAVAPRPGATLTRPAPFTLTPDQVTAANYKLYVHRYQVSDAKAPPEPYVTAAKTFEGSATHESNGEQTKIFEVPLPAGYEAVTGHAIASASHWNDRNDDWALHVAIGKDLWRRDKNSFVNHYFTLDGEQGALPLGVRTFGVASWYVTCEIDCRRTDRAFEEWRLQTHAAIMQAYLQMERDYQDGVAALEVRAAAEIPGRNARENRLIELAELRRLAISTITAQHFDLFGAIMPSGEGYPQPDLPEAEAEGRYVRFFEQAFEWEQTMYVFYPYYWGRKGNWRDRVLLQDTDPEFAEFLKAGSARVVVPVRPGFEAALAHFLDTGEIWEGADPPTLTSPLYVSIIKEIKERDQAPGGEQPQGEPWDVRLPTTLVRLRPDGTLPEWEKSPDGTWAPV